MEFNDNQLNTIKTFYTLQFQNRTFPVNSNVRLHEGKLLDNGNVQLYAVIDGKLHCFQHENGEWHRSVLADDFAGVQQLYFANILDTGPDVLITKQEDGIRFYRYEDNNVCVINEDEDFHDLYGWSDSGSVLKFGRMYKDRSLLGLMAKNNGLNTTQFYAVMKKELFAAEPALWPLRGRNRNIFGDSLLNETKLYLADLQQDGQDDVVVRTNSGLDVYKFDESNYFQHVLSVACCSDLFEPSDELFFSNVSGGKFKDVINLNSTGLYLHRYDETLKSYRFSNYHPFFSLKKGWQKQHTETMVFRDIDHDGADDLIFTGPQGVSILSYNLRSNRLESLLDSYRLSVKQRDSRVVQVVALDSNHYSVVLLHQDQLLTAQISNIQKEIIEEKVSYNVSTSVDKLANLSVKPKPLRNYQSILYLRDQLDYSVLTDAVDRASGKLKFMIPLVDITSLIINLKIFYDSMSSGILGFGWSFQQNLIMLSHQASVFPEDSKYYLMYQQSLQELKLIPNNSTDAVQYFRLKEVGEAGGPAIRYYRSEEKWELIQGNMKQVYGNVGQAGSVAAVLKENTWVNWRGQGESSTGQVQIASGWYLTEVSDRSNVVRFSYMQKEKLHNAAKSGITTDVYLKEISDANGNTISLKYQPTSDYELKNKSKAKNKLALYLSGYILNSASGIQDIDFLYTLRNSRRLLTAIVQKDDGPVFEFSYNEHYLISDIKFLQEGHVNIMYTGQVLDARSSGPLKSAAVYRGYRITSGSNYLMISYVNSSGQLEMKIFDEEMKQELYSPTSASADTRLPLFGSYQTVYSILEHEVFEGRNFMAVVISYRNSTELFLFSVKKGKITVSPKSFIYTINSIIRFGSDFVVVVDKSLELIDWDSRLNEWAARSVSASGRSHATVAASDRMFALYNDSELTIWYRDVNRVWQSKIIERIPNLISALSDSLNEFAMSSQLVDIFKYYSMNRMLQFNSNMILLNSWQLNDYTLSSVIKLLLLNRNYEIVDRFEKRFTHEDLRTFTREVTASNNSFNCRYIQQDGKFKFSVISYRGQLYDDIEAEKKKNEQKIREARATRAEKDKALQVIRKQVEDYHAEVMRNITNAWGSEIFLFDNVYQKYHATLAVPNIIAHNSNYHFDGSRWQEKPPKGNEEVSITLGDDYILSKERAESSIKLYTQTRSGDKEERYIEDLGTRHLTETLVRFPYYLAYQPTGKQAKVVEFSDNGDIAGRYSIPSDQKLSLSSGHQGLFTDSGYDSTNLTWLYFFPIIGMRRLSPDIVVSQTTLTLKDGIKRFTGYEYNSSSAYPLENSIFYQQTVLIPGNDKRSFGWIKETRTGNSTSKQIFNGYGSLVKTVAEDQDSAGENEVIPRNTTMFDKYNRHPVAYFFPYPVHDDIVNYYGFEDYELNSSKNQPDNTTKRWIFNETNIVRNSFSFTGRNYLHLKANDFLQGFYFLGNSSMTFLASCWVRPQFAVPGLGSTVPYMKIVAGSAQSGDGVGLLSEVKLRSGAWYYLESVINLFYTRMNINSNRTSSDPLDDIGIHVIISGADNSTIDVDHVRFSPINCRFKGRVYNWSTHTVTEEISFNGLVKRYVYDKYKEKIATINEYGVISEFRTYSKVSSRGALIQPASNILIRPENGFYEDFSPDSMAEHWTVSNESAFQVSPGYIEHTDAVHSALLSLRHAGINRDSFAIRLLYHMKSNNATISLNTVTMSRGNDGCYYQARTQADQPTLVAPCEGEMLLLSERGRFVAWLDGGLYDDAGDRALLNAVNHPTNILNIKLSGSISIEQLMVLNSLNLKVIYFSGGGEKIQEIKLEDESNVIVTAYLYDPIGRQSITTKPIRISRLTGDRMFGYYSNLVSNHDPYASDSVWKTGIIKGDTYGGAKLGEYDYTETKYNNDSLEFQRIIGYPGKEFSTIGPYSTKYAADCEILFINNLYPAREGYRYVTEYKAGALVEVQVFDTRDNQVARYSHAPGGQQLLSTYEYDDKNRLVKLLPPLYHEKAGTFFKLGSTPHAILDQEYSLQRLLGTHLTYDLHDNVLTKTTPDSGKVQNIYDSNGLLKFVVFYDFTDRETVDKILYFNYDHFFRVTSSGLLDNKVPVAALLNTIHNNTSNFQEFYYNDDDYEPTSRARIRRTITFNDKVPFIEQIQLNGNKKVSNKRITLPLDLDEPVTIDINKRYAGDNMVEIEYPIEFQNEPLVLKYEYNRLGKMKTIGLNNSLLFFHFEYNPSGQLSRADHVPSSAHSFSRHYSYNSPGFPTRIQDRYLTENVYYTESGYGGYGYGDGTITRTEYLASWHNCSNINYRTHFNAESFKTNSMNEYESKLCFEHLKEAGYIDNSNHQTRVLYPQLDIRMPLLCSHGTTGRHVSSVLGAKGFPERFGHVYDYGNHLELTKAKYFVGDQVPTPLQPDTFAKEIKAINNNITMSREIWRLLKESLYLIEDRDKSEFSIAHSKRGKSFINPSLAEDLRKIGGHGITLNVSKLLSSLYCNRQTLSKSEFANIYSKWKNSYSDQSEIDKAGQVFEMLENKSYLKNPLDKTILDKLNKFELIMPDIIKVLWEYFGRELGEAEFDVESYEVDANGNHKHYYTGFDRYEILYSNNTNHVETVKFKSFASSAPEQKFQVEHDNRGNVVKALHKGIKHIEYNAVLNRASKIYLVDGRIISFIYDANGERILKRVQNGRGDTLTAVHYIRDELGRSLVEREFTYVAPDKAPDFMTTAYIYGPGGLIGFIRRDEFYSVICDHEYSVRLIVKNSEVVAAYDYLPYGATMRHFSSYPEADIAYRYTGQEWDEELGLYNFHVRLYDPSIGRFYQIDPKEQYFSPYKYAGNSPISMIDPDGQFAFLIFFIVVGAIAGAYLGGAAANGTLNITKWNFKSGKTWLGIFSGALIGGMLPLGFSGSMAAFTALGLSKGVSIALTTGLGLAGAYVNTAVATRQPNPIKWDWKSPLVLNSLFAGFAGGSGLAGGFHATGRFYLSLGGRGKVLFVGASTATAGGLFTLQGFANNWDFSSPDLWLGLVESIINAADLPMLIRGASKFLSKNGRSISNNFSKIRQFIKEEGNYFSHFSKMKGEWIPIGKSVGKLGSAVLLMSLAPYLIGAAANDDFDPKHWDMKSAGTYQAILNGLQTGSQFGRILTGGKKYYQNFRAKQKTKVAKLSEHVAKEAVEKYKTIVDEIKKRLVNRNDPSLVDAITTQSIQPNQYSPMVTNKLTSGKIPNTVVGVGISDKFVIAAFSTNDAPGLLLLFTHKKMSSSTFVERQFLEHNLKIAGRNVKLSEDPIRNDYLMNRIKETQNAIKESIIPNYVRKFEADAPLINSALRKLTGMHDDSIESIKSILKNKIKEDAYIKNTRVTITEVLTGYYNEIVKVRVLPLAGEVKKMRGLLNKKKNEFKRIKDETSEQYKKFKEEIEQMELAESKKSTELNELKKKLINERTETITELTKVFEDYGKELTLWSEINCAEPHVLTTFARIREVFSHNNFGGTFNDRATDIKYMAAYNVHKNFKPYPRCDNCKISTAHIKHVITDPAWMEVLNGNLLARTKLNLINSKQDLYFLIPNELLLTHTLRPNSTNTTNSSRPKREILHELSSVYSHSRSRNNVEDEVTGEYATNDATRSTPYLNQIIGWFKDSFNKLARITDNSQYKRESESSYSGQTWPGSIDINSSLLLLNVIAAKVFDTKLIPFAGHGGINDKDALVHALTITDKFESLLMETIANHTHALPDSLSHAGNFSEVQNIIHKKLMSNKFHEINRVLKSYSQSLYPAYQLDNLDKINRETFLDRLNGNIDLFIDDYLHEINSEQLGSDSCSKQPPVMPAPVSGSQPHFSSLDCSQLLL